MPKVIQILIINPHLKYQQSTNPINLTVSVDKYNEFCVLRSSLVEYALLAVHPKQRAYVLGHSFQHGDFWLQSDNTFGKYILHCSISITLFPFQSNSKFIMVKEQYSQYYSSWSLLSAFLWSAFTINRLVSSEILSHLYQTLIINIFYIICLSLYFPFSIQLLYFNAPFSFFQY